MVKVNKENKIKIPGLFKNANLMDSLDMQSNFVQGKVNIDSNVRVPRIMEPMNGARIVGARSRAKSPRPSSGNHYGLGKNIF